MPCCFFKVRGVEKVLCAGTWCGRVLVEGYNISIMKNISILKSISILKNISVLNGIGMFSLSTC